MKSPLLLIGALTICGTTHGAILTPEQALQRARHAAPAKIISATQQAPTLAKTIEIDNQAACYVFDSGAGYFVLSADDATPAMLGYSDSGTFDFQIPALKYWLDSYAREIAYARTLGLPQASAKAKAASEKEPILPLTGTRWNQNAPFNDLCPMDNGTRSVTGCVATALAQVMKYHNYPPKGKGSNSYSCLNQTLSVDFGNTQYDWDQMLNVYDNNATAAQNQAVATLMYSCGVSVNMDYTSSESGASSLKVPAAMVNYFDYDKGIRYFDRDYFGLDEWQDIVYNQLKDYGPVQYSGESSEGGHSFVCDGYSQDGYFHINWGWGGMSDGYFLLTALDPTTQGIGGSTSGFNYAQDIIGNVSKPREGSRVYEQILFSDNFTISTSSSYLGSSIKIEGPLYNFSIDKISGTMGLKFTSASGETYYGEGQRYSEMPMLSGFNSYEGTIPSSLPEGTYTVTPAYKNSYGQWQDAGVPIACVRSYTANVNGGYVTFTANVAPKITFQNLNTNVTPYYADSNFEVTATLVNNSSAEYYGSILAALIDENQNLIAYGDNYPVDLMPGESVDMTYVSAFSHLPQNSEYQSASEISAGQYYLCFLSADLGTALTVGYPINLQSAPEDTQISVDQVQFADGGTVLVDKSHLQVTASVTCQSGYFANSLTLAIFPYSTGSVDAIASFDSNPTFINAGESQTLTFNGDFAAAEEGTQYMAYVFNGQSQVSYNPLVFTVSTAGIDDIGIDAANAKYYNLQGQPLTNPQPGSLIIRMADGKASKILF